MRFLIDENLPRSLGKIFKKQGFIVKNVKDSPKLRGQPDEVIFNYSAKKEYIVITRDIGFSNLTRFNQHKLPGLVLIRFPNEISIKNLIQETERLVKGFSKEDYKALIIIEPGSVRKRLLQQ